MTTKTHLGNGIYITSATAGIISHCDVAITNASSPYTALAYDYIIRADATSGAITINLPTAVGIAGKEYHIFRTDIVTSTNIITIDANSTETIDSNLTYRLYPGEWVKLESDGANWQVIGRPTPSIHGYYMIKNTANFTQVAGFSMGTATGCLTSTTSPALGTLWAYPLIVSKTTKFDTINFSVTSVSTAGKSHVGIYADNGNSYPGALIFDSGDIDTTGTGIKATTITSAKQVFQPGLYWLAYEQDTATGQYRILCGLGTVMNVMAVNINTTANQMWHYNVAHTFGALPDPYTAAANLSNTSSAAGTPLVAVGLHPV